MCGCTELNIAIKAKAEVRAENNPLTTPDFRLAWLGVFQKSITVDDFAKICYTVIIRSLCSDDGIMEDSL